MKPEITYYFLHQKEFSLEQIKAIYEGTCKPYILKGDILGHFRPTLWRERGGSDAVLPKSFYRRRA